MPKKRFSAEQIVTVLRQIEVLMSQGKAAPVCLSRGGHLAAELLSAGAKSTAVLSLIRPGA